LTLTQISILEQGQTYVLSPAPLTEWNLRSPGSPMELEHTNTWLWYRGGSDDNDTNA